MAEQLLIMPSLVLGLAIGLYEAGLIHRDVVVPTHRLGHMIHALILAIVATFITMNTAFVIKLLNISPNMMFTGGTVLLLQIAVGLFMLFKIHGVSSVLKGSGMSSAGTAETWTHSLLVCALIVAAPYVWPLIAGVAPVWMRN